MADKNKKKKTYKKKYTSVRDDYRKGGRVKAQVGGLKKAPLPKKGSDQMFISKTEQETKTSKPTKTTKTIPQEDRPNNVKKFIDDTPLGKVTGVPNVVGADRTGFERNQTGNKVDPMEITSIERIPNEEDLEREMFEEEQRRAAEEASRKAAEEAARKAASPEIMRETTPPGTTFTTTNQQGQTVNLPNMLTWEKQWLLENPKPTQGGLAGKLKRDKWQTRFDIAKEEHQALLDTSNANLPNTTTEQQKSNFEKARRERIRETGLQIEAASTGQVPEGAIIPDAEKVTGEIPQEVTTMAEPTEATAAIAGQVAPEAVTTGQVTTAQTPEQIQAAQMEAAMVSPDAQVEAAEGELSRIAEAAGVDRVAPIEGAEVEIPAGALAERVVGTISEGAKATAAMNAGTSLSRITRAKKQLSRAGLSDADIEEIGNDPEALEDRLADFSEEQRGIIEGLPQEALVSTQMNNLLEGIESGEIPTWARPAVAQVEQMLAQRGMSASTVGRDSLFNAIIQSAMPIAQSNAQAIQSSVSQQRTIEAQAAEANAQRMQQTALTNAQNVFNMDMAQFSADQQTALSNSKFLQTVGLTEASNEQQGVIQNALLMSQANLAEADFYQKTQIQNAQAFLSMDMANLNNKQQANVLKAQQNQQRLLSNQSAQNAAAQFNAASENQTNQFMTNLNAQMNQYNASQMNAMEQFNATQANAAEARRAGREADIEKFNAQLISQVDQFNSQQDFARNQWNAQNAAAVEASNVQWRRQANTINTAAQNQINMQNAQNAFGLSTQAMSFLWQELRDQADFDFRAFENEENRKAQIIATAMANEGAAGERYDDYLTNLLTTVSSSYKAGIIS